MNIVEKFNKKYGSVYESFDGWADFKINYFDKHEDVDFSEPWLEDGCTLASCADNNHLDEIVVIEEDCMMQFKLMIQFTGRGF